MPSNVGLYNSAYEHDACGVAMVVDIHGRRSRDIVDHAITALLNLEHRGAAGAEPNSGDGAGIMIQVPDKFLRAVCKENEGFDLPDEGSYATGIAFLPQSSRDAVLASLPGVEADNIIQPLGDGADQGGSEALIRAWPRHGSLPRQVLLVRAQKGREKLSDWFARQGAIVIDLVAYVRQEHVPSEADWSRLRRAMDAGASLAVLYTSSEAVGVLSHQFESAPPSCALLASARSLCIHERIQDRLHQAGILDTRICGLQADAIAEALAFQALPDTVPLQDTQPPVPPLDIEL